jgi:hypothetical protein
MKIDQMFAFDNFSEPAKLDWVRQEAEYLMKVMEADPNVSLAERLGQAMPPESLLRFFRQRERTEKARCIIQYLLTFLGHIPSSSEVQGDLVDPTEQFRAFVAYEADLLLEDDVKNAVFEETNHNGTPRAGSVWDYQERILVVNRVLRGMLAKREQDRNAAIATMCRAVEQLALFWFDVRRHDLRRVRRSDIFMFLLAQLVRSRCRGLADA